MFQRIYSPLEQHVQPGKALIIFGPRQVGKTTLVETYLNKTKYNYRHETGDNTAIHQILGTPNLEQLKEYLAGYQLLFIDEAQKIENIGLSLKLIIDQIPDVCIIATGSSSFKLAGDVGEPLTGRKKTLTLYPLSQLELLKKYNAFDLKQNLEQYLIYGCYPEIVSATSLEEKRELLMELMQSYLLKDILEMESVKNAKVLLDLLRLLAYQVGGEVSLSELGRQLGLNYKTVARYIDLLEKAFVIYSLGGYSGNLRKEVTKKYKYYFFDNGIRNAIISNFNTINLRNDIGQLWENFLIMERIKRQTYCRDYANNYFWRTWDQQEIDWVEEREGNLFAYEFKWGNNKRISAPKKWKGAYTNAEFLVVNRDNYFDFIT